MSRLNQFAREAAAALLRMAKTTKDPTVAAGLVQRAADLKDRTGELPAIDVEAMAEEEARVVLRCRPYETFAQPPRHLHHNDQAERITHWISASMPWDAIDRAPDE